MTLPDDFTRWPKNPYDLLGVGQTIDSRELRRAYTRLIKVYKPEHAPEQFRLLREAYETILQHVKWRERYNIQIRVDSDQENQDEDSSSDPFASPAATFEVLPENSTQAPDEPTESAGRENPEQPAPALPAPAAANSSDSNDPPPQRTRVTDPLRDAWQLALDGNPGQAFADLKKLAAQRGLSPPISVRLYWLLKTFPEIAPDLQPCSILAKGLLNEGWDSELCELYRRELLDQPTETATKRFATLLASAPVGLLSEWLPLRWCAARHRQQIQLLGEDLLQFRELVIQDDEQSWARLLFAALDQLAWSTDPLAEKLYQQCQAELTSLTHLQLPMSDAYDRMDLLSEMMRKWAEIPHNRQVPSLLRQVIADSWETPFAQTRFALTRLIQWMAQQPAEALETLDGFRPAAACLLTQLDNAVRRYGYAEGADFDSLDDAEQVLQLLLAFMKRSNKLYYRHLRLHLLQFCLRQGVLIEELVEYGSPLLDDYRFNNEDNFLEKLKDDWPLRCICRAQRVFFN